MALSLGVRKDQRILIGAVLIGIKTIRSLDEIVVGLAPVSDGDRRHVLGLMDRMKAHGVFHARADFPFTPTDRSMLERLYGLDLDTHFTITDREATEVAPRVMVSAGITPGMDQEYAKLAIAAPSEIRIVRLPRVSAHA